MAITKCDVCGFLYDEWAGDVKNGVPKGTPLSSLAGTLCTTCGMEEERRKRLPNPSYSGLEAQYYDQFVGKVGIAFYRQFIFPVKDHAKVLEIGVGTGRIGIDLCKNGIEVFGIDNSSDMLETVLVQKFQLT
jgi:rubredoxin